MLELDNKRPHIATNDWGLVTYIGGNMSNSSISSNNIKICSVSGCSLPYARYGHCAKHRHLYKTYKFTNEQMKNLPTACELCGSNEDLRVDHDHSCCSSARTCGKCFRGVLCDRCNRALGFFYDNPNLLREAAKYLEDRG